MYGPYNPNQQQYPPQNQHPYNQGSRVDRNYYDRIRQNNYQQQMNPYGPNPNPYPQGYDPYNQPQIDPYRCDPYQQRQVNPYNQPSRGYIPPYGQTNPYGQPNNASIINTYQQLPNTSGGSTFNIPSCNIEPEPITTNQNTIPVDEPVIKNVDILDYIRELKTQGFTPTPDSVKLPLYDETKYELDVVVRGKNYTIFVVPKQ